MLLKIIIIIITNIITVERVALSAIGHHRHSAKVGSAEPILHRLPTACAGERIASYSGSKILAKRFLQREERRSVAIPTFLPNTS